MAAVCKNCPFVLLAPWSVGQPALSELGPGLRTGMADMRGARTACTWWFKSAKSAIYRCSCWLIFHSPDCGEW